MKWHIVDSISCRVVTYEEAEAIAELKRSQVRDKVVRFLQCEAREGREATEA